MSYEENFMYKLLNNQKSSKKNKIERNLWTKDQKLFEKIWPQLGNDIYKEENIKKFSSTKINKKTLKNKINNIKRHCLETGTMLSYLPNDLKKEVKKVLYKKEDDWKNSQKIIKETDKQKV